MRENMVTYTLIGLQGEFTMMNFHIISSQLTALLETDARGQNPIFYLFRHGNKDTQQT